MTFNHGVEGSSPPALTINNRKINNLPRIARSNRADKNSFTVRTMSAEGYPPTCSQTEVLCSRLLFSSRMAREQKITLGEMRQSGPRRLLSTAAITSVRPLRDRRRSLGR